MKILLLIAAISCHYLDVVPQSPPIVPWVKSTENRVFLFKMVPAKWRKEGEELVVEREAFGVAYEVDFEGELHELWHTKGWYCYEGYLSEDGRYFVRMGGWAFDHKEHTDLAIAFYDRGKLLKKYEVRDLIKHPDRLRGIPNYDWRPEIQSEPNGIRDRAFHFVMIDKTAYRFDYQTGKIIDSHIDQGAKSREEISDEEQAAAEQKGKDLFAASDFHQAYEEQFQISEIEASLGSTVGVYFFPTAQWRAGLIPRKKYSQSCFVEAIFPIRDGKTIVASMTPTEIDTALAVALSHPFIAERFKMGGATGLRLRITGDRLHWDTPELQDFLAKTKGEKPKDQVLRDWAYLIIDAKEPEFTSVYLNIKSGELIYEDKSKKRWPPVLLDASGIRIRVGKQ